MRTWLLPAATVLLSGAFRVVLAADAPKWEIGGGLGFISFPDYRGAETRTDYVVPIPYFVYRGDRLRLDREGLRGLLFDAERWKADVSVDGTVPVKSDADGARAGMPDLDPAFEFGPSLAYEALRTQTSKIELRFPVRAVLATDFSSVHREGWVFHPHLFARYWNGYDFGFSAGPMFGSAEYHRYYYSVAPEYATAWRPAYTPGGGYSGFRVTLGASRRLGRLYIGAFMRYDNLSGAAFADSPLVETEHALMGGLSVAWVFAQSAQRVTVADNDTGLP